MAEQRELKSHIEKLDKADVKGFYTKKQLQDYLGVGRAAVDTFTKDLDVFCFDGRHKSFFIGDILKKISKSKKRYAVNISK